MTTVSEIMTSDPICCFGTDSVQRAAVLMRENDIGDVLVMNGDSLVGIITDRDIAVRVVAEGIDAGSTSIFDVCTQGVTTVSPRDDAHLAVQAMRERNIRRLPVVDEHGTPVGVITIGDLAVELDSNSALADISMAPANS